MGIAKSGISVARQSRRKMKIISTTRIEASQSVFGHLTFDDRNESLNPIGHIKEVRLRLADDSHADSWAALEKRLAAIILAAQLHAPHIGKFHLVIARRRQHEVLVIDRVGHVALHFNRKFARNRFDAPTRDFHVLLAQRTLHIGDGQVVSGKPVGIHPKPHRVARPANIDRAHAGHGLQPLNGDALNDLVKLGTVVPVGVKRNRHNGARIGLGLCYPHIFDFGRQPPLGAAHPVAHVVGRFVDIAAQVKLHGDLRTLLCGGRADEPNALNGSDFLF